MTASLPSIPVVSRRLRSTFLVSSFVLMALLLAVPIASAQRRAAAPSGAVEETAAYKDYRGIQLGMTADEVRKKLGAPKDKGDEQDFYVFSDTETAQIVYDATHKVITISADFMTTGDTVPTAKQVLGGEIEAKVDGSAYKMLRFPKAGYWISFNRTAGTTPLTTVTLQKIQ
ncbi:MAG TPA: hypothetical protein VLL54_07040 [Pyrinomonadaceae bacterium]|nr:hypothetical protein [Pyrinomonadaceae bacterium]